MSLDATRSYYDEFAARYERERRPAQPDGYHAMLDDMEVALVRRYGTSGSVLECGCGTGLLLERFSEFAVRAEGIDLSPGMLEQARARGLSVAEASITELPFADHTFDVTCSFKVLAHVPDLARALREMARVTKPGGTILAELYNPYSLRALAKRWGPAGAISATTKESAVYTRFDSPFAIERVMPAGVRLETIRGIRIVTPAASFMRVPLLKSVLRRTEQALSGTKAAYLAGFVVAVLRKS
jgi:ubiquinone/menaquinone biosynthesis C-methylase UbiE